MNYNVVYHEPFNYTVIDNFIEEKTANLLFEEFPSYNSAIWDTAGYTYNNPLEMKKTIRDWKVFPQSTYSLFTKLCSPGICNQIKEIFNNKNNVYPDYGLHGAGWHIHKKGDHLNIHLDYSLHPLVNLQRKYNLILYLTPDWSPEWGGGLEFWSHDLTKNQPKEKIKIIENKFNRAVIFDTTQNSWHGISEEIKCPDNVYRRSIAMYYLTDLFPTVENRKRALYAPLKLQREDESILQLIKKRAGL